MTKAHKAIDSQVDVSLDSTSDLNNISTLHVADAAEFLKLIESLEDDEFILAKCLNFQVAKSEDWESVTRYFLFIEGFGSLAWTYDHTEKGESK